MKLTSFVVLAATLAAVVPARGDCPDGLFTPTASFPTGHYPAYSAVADLDGDGRDDVATPNFVEGSLTIRLGAPPTASGLPTLSASIFVSMPSAPRSVAVADFDRDGVPDLAVALTSSTNLVVLFGQRSPGAWAVRDRFSGALGSGGGRDLAIADFDRDGWLDIALGTDSGFLIAHAAAGGLTFVAESVVPRQAVWAIAAGDFSGDGYPDLFVGGPVGGANTILPNLTTQRPGQSWFGEPVAVPFSVAPFRAKVADFRGDGVPDVLLACDGSVTLVEVSRQPGSTQLNLVPRQILSGLAHNDATPIEFSGDGLLDVAVMATGAREIRLLRADALATGEWAGTFTAVPSIATGDGIGIAAGDLDNDGFDDLVWTVVSDIALKAIRGLCGLPPGLGHLATSTVGPGQVTFTPSGAIHPLGTLMELTATPTGTAQFLGWTGGLHGSLTPDTLRLSRFERVTAWFASDPYALTTAVEGEGSIVRDPDLVAYPQGWIVQLTAVPAPGQLFDHWSGELQSTSATAAITMNGPRSVTAHFRELRYRLNTLVPFGGTVTRDPDLPDYRPFTWVTVTANPAPGYVFVRWAGDTATTVNPIVVPMSRDRTIAPVFELARYPLSVVASGPGTVQVVPSQPNYPHGTTVVLTATPELGADFRGWSGDVTSMDNPLTLVMTSPVQLTANFGPNPLTLPRIRSVRDVALDQGRQVKLSWFASALDLPPGDPHRVVGTYVVWRSVPEAIALAAIGEGTAQWDDGAIKAPVPGERWIRRMRLFDTDYFWEYMATQPAGALPGYSYVSATTSDSSAVGIPWTAFLVQARSLDGQRWWNSSPDSGYSVDNLAPPAPASATVYRTAPQTRFVWEPSGAADVASYRVYAGASADFTPSPATRLGETTERTFESPVPLDAQSWAKITAVDAHGNEGPPVSIALATLDAPDAPGPLALAPPVPNPAAGRLTVRFTLPRGGRTRWELLDVAGRRVAGEDATVLAAGSHRRELLLGPDVRPGLYLLRLEHEGEQRLRRLTVLR